MKKIIFLLLVLLTAGYIRLFSQTEQDTSVYLITCGPGAETYSHYGHSALRVIIPERKSDLVYNWGVFDFSTPHFAYRFARGRLEYMLDKDTFKRFLQSYFYEKRWVEVQKINLEPGEIKILLDLISENLKPENRKYRYDFFYDDCSTRIRDLLEKAIGRNLIYAPSGPDEKLTFRFLTGKYQRPYPWLNFGIDLLMGTPSDKKASYRDMMFLPIEMQTELSEALISRNGKMIPLLSNPETILDFNTPVIKPNFFTTPVFIFTLLCVVLIIFYSMVKNRRTIKTADIIIFAVYSSLVILMLFTNFITDHQQMKKNLSLLWLSPFVPVCLAAVVLNKKWFVWFRIVFILCLISFVIQIAFPGMVNNAFIPLILILFLRSSARAGFSWNPLSVKTF
jgi:hypothetical protein